MDADAAPSGGFVRWSPSGAPPEKHSARPDSGIALSSPNSQRQPLTSLAGTGDVDNDPEEGFLGPREADLGPSLTSVIKKIVTTLLIFIGLCVLLEWWAEDRVRTISKGLFRKIGLPGLWLLIFIFDGIPQPMTYIPLIFLAVKAKYTRLEVWGICTSASYTAAIVGYFIGVFIRSRPIGNAFSSWINSSRPWVAEMMRRRGATGVAFAAALPIPLALATWIAGFLRVDFRRFLLAASCRTIKIMLVVIISGT